MRPAQSSMLTFCHSAGSWGVIRLSNSAANPARLRLMCWSRPVSHTQCLCGRSPLWSAAACCRFGASQLAGWELCPRLKFPQASSRPGKQSRKAGPHSKVSHPHPPFQTGGEKSGLGHSRARSPAGAERSSATGVWKELKRAYPCSRGTNH